MAQNHSGGYGRETAQQAIETARQFEANARAKSAVLRNGGRSAPHSSAENMGGLSTKEQWDARKNASENVARLKPLQGMSYITPYGPSMQEMGAAQTHTMGAGVLNPYIDHSGVPAINNPGPKLPSITLPQTATNYKGETNFFDPTSGASGAPVTEIDPAKDQRYSVNGVTSAGNTTQGILDRYQTPGTTANFTPGNVTQADGTTMAPGGAVTPPQYDFKSARTAAIKQYPDIATAGTPQNTAFVQHAAQNGEQSAHANIDNIMKDITPAAPKVASASPSTLSPY